MTWLKQRPKITWYFRSLNKVRYLAQKSIAVLQENNTFENEHHVNLLPNATNLQQTTLNVSWKGSISVGIISKNRWKHWSKRRNCSFWAISSFGIMFSKSWLLPRRQKASIWLKCLINYTSWFRLLLDHYCSWYINHTTPDHQNCVDEKGWSGSINPPLYS